MSCEQDPCLSRPYRTELTSVESGCLFNLLVQCGWAPKFSKGRGESRMPPPRVSSLHALPFPPVPRFSLNVAPRASHRTPTSTTTRPG